MTLTNGISQTEISIDEFEGWGKAPETIDIIIKTGKADDFDKLIEKLYPNGIREIQLNDLLRFDDTWIYESLGITKSYKLSVYNIEYEVDEDEDEENLPKSMTLELEDVEIDENDENLKNAIVEAIETETGNSVVDYDYTIIEEEYE